MTKRTPRQPSLRAHSSECGYAQTMKRWTSAYTFAWNPIITFKSRAPRFLEWIEANSHPVAFATGDDFIGLAIESQGIRLELRPENMTILDGAAHGSPVSVVEHALEGVFEVMEPSDMVLETFIAAWSRPLPGLEYRPARAAFSERVTGIEGHQTLRAFDVSALADIEGDTFAAQVEWGIVEPKELRQILMHPQRGRLSENRPGLLGNPHALSNVPKVSAFAETYVRYLASDTVTDYTELAKVVSSADSIGKEIAESVTLGFTTKEITP